MRTSMTLTHQGQGHGASEITKIALS